MGYITAFGIQNGNPRRLMHGLDYKGALCGVDPEVLYTPKLFWCPVGDIRPSGFPSALDLENPVCVSKCPEDFSQDIACPGPSVQVVERTGVSPYITIKTTVTQSSVSRKSYPTIDVAGIYCVPQRSMTNDLPGNDTLTKSLMGLNGPIGNSFTSIMFGGLGSVRRCWPVLVGSLVVAIAMSFTHLFLVRNFAPLVIAVTLLSLNLILWSLALYFLLGQIVPGNAQTAWQSSNWYFHSYDQQTAAMLSCATGVAFLVLAAVVLCITCVASEAIKTATAVVRAACECVFSMPSLLLQPLVEAAWKVILFGMLLCGLVYLVSTAKPVPDIIKVNGIQIGGLTRTLELSTPVKWMLLYYGIGSLWLMELSNSMAQFVTAYGVVRWYYTPKPKGFGPIMPLTSGFIVGSVFHLGSLAFGSLLITFCRAARALLGFISHQAKSGGNRVCGILANCCLCCIGCFQKYLEYVNKNAYIDICINSSNFCTAAQNATTFLAAEAGKVVLLMGSLWIICVVGVLAISMATAVVTFLIVTSFARWTDANSESYVCSPYFVAVVAGLLGCVISASFAVVLDHTADTLLYTFCWNKAHGHNTAQKFVPDSLAALAEYKPRPGTSSDRSSSSAQSTGIWGMFFGSHRQAPHEHETEMLMSHGADPEPHH